MSRKDGSRLRAARIISGVRDNKLNMDEAGGEKPGGLDPRDAAFTTHLVYGVLRWLSALQWIANQRLQKPLTTKDQDIYRLILIGLFQLWKQRGIGQT